MKTIAIVIVYAVVAVLVDVYFVWYLDQLSLQSDQNMSLHSGWKKCKLICNKTHSGHWDVNIQGGNFVFTVDIYTPRLLFQLMDNSSINSLGCNTPTGNTGNIFCCVLWTHFSTILGS